MELPFLANQRLTDEQIRRIVSLDDGQNPVRYAVVGKLSPRGDYGKVALLVTATHLFTTLCVVWLSIGLCAIRS